MTTLSNKVTIRRIGLNNAWEALCAYVADEAGAREGALLHIQDRRALTSEEADELARIEAAFRALEYLGAHALNG
jgi:hypothetical protein